MCNAPLGFEVPMPNCAVEPDTIPAPNPTIAAADKEPLIEEAICAEQDKKQSP